MKIAVDLDNTLAATEAVIRTAIGEALGLWFPADSIVDYDIQRNYNLTDAQMETVLAHIRQEGRWRAIPPLPGCTQFMRSLKAAHEVTVLTARPATMQELTSGWLADQQIEPHALRFVDKDGADETCRPETEYDVFIEDHPTFSVRMAAAGRLVFLRDQPWNRASNHANLQRFSDYATVLRALT